MRRILVVAIAAGICGSTVCHVFALDDGDWQVWNNNAFEAKVAEGWKIKIAEEFRVGEDMSQIYEQFTEVGVTHDLTKWFQLGVDYRHDYKRSGLNWKMEERPQVNGTLLWNLGALGFQDRSRLERRMFETADDVWRYRNKLTVTLPAGLTGSLVKPYLAYEGFLDLSNDREYSRYRLYAGFKKSITKTLGVDLYFMRQSTKSGEDWIDYNVLGVGLRAS
jgi:hypothetical protein